jgi:hypothetical protein
MTSTQEIAPPEEKNSFDLTACNWRLAYLAVLAGASQRPHSPTRLHFLVYGVPRGVGESLSLFLRDSDADVRRKSRML